MNTNKIRNNVRNNKRIFNERIMIKTLYKQFFKYIKIYYFV